MLLLKVASFLLAVFAVSFIATRMLTGEQIVLGIVFLVIAVNIVDMGKRRV